MNDSLRSIYARVTTNSSILKDHQPKAPIQHPHLKPLIADIASDSHPLYPSLSNHLLDLCICAVKSDGSLSAFIIVRSEYLLQVDRQRVQQKDSYAFTDLRRTVEPPRRRAYAYIIYG